MRRPSLMLVVTLTVVFALSVFAQDVIVNVNLTMLRVFVEDEQGHAVLDLRRTTLKWLKTAERYR